MKNFFNKKTLLVFGLPILLVCIIAVLVIVIMLNRQDEPMPDRVVITYANWNLGERRDNALELRMLQAFMDEHPHIYVEIDTGVSVRPNWHDNIIAAANARRLPDVFMVDDMADMVGRGLLMDITEMVLQDVGFFDLPRIVQEAVLVGGTAHALPFAQELHGYFVNRDLFRELGLGPPEFGISAADFISAIRAATNLARPSVGINNTHSFVDWFPGAVNPRLGFFAYDGLGFALNSPEMLEAVRVAGELHRMGYTFDGLADAAAYFPIGYSLGAFRVGQMAFFYGSTRLMNMMATQIDFDWDFIGVPGGRAITTLEVVGISANTRHPEEAYLLARWMGFCADGSLRRMQIARDLGIVPESFPLSQSARVLNALWPIAPAAGLREVYNAMDRVLVDGLRVMPGYIQARFSAPTGVAIVGTPHNNAGIDPLMLYSIIGDVYFPYYSAMAEELARQQLEEALAALR